MRKWLYFIWWLSFTGAAAQAQTYVLSPGKVQACSGKLQDPGGLRDYPVNQEFITTICPGDTNKQLALTFRQIDIRRGDQLCLYDGQDTLSPKLSCSQNWPSGGTDVQASTVNPSGCLTLHWKSDGIPGGKGFEATISCRAVCQSIKPQIVAGGGYLDSTGVYLIDLCPGGLFTLQAIAEFAQNERAYHQDLATTSYQWRLPDGSERQGSSLQTAFAAAGGYTFELTATDAKGCRSLEPLRVRARVAAPPKFSLPADWPDTICAPNLLELRLPPLGQAQVLAKAPTQYFSPTTSRVDSLPLPDGTGAAHESAVYLSQFEEGATLTRGKDLLAVCATMEHSWLRDLSVDLISPSGQLIELHDHPGRFGTEVYLGEPIERDNNVYPPKPGVGYEYCWTAAASNSTWLKYLRDRPTTKTLPPGDYAPYDSFDRLVGAQLNGSWTLRVKDHWEADNGWIFSWRLEFSDSIPRRLDSFQTTIVRQWWRANPAQASYTPEAIAYAPTRAGTIAPSVQVTDNFGCRHDTSFQVTVLPERHPHCGVCQNSLDSLPTQIIALGDTVTFDLRAALAGAGSYAYAGTAPFSFASHPPERPLELALQILSPPIENLALDGKGLVEVCVELHARDAEEIQLALQLPSGGNGPGQTLQLARNDQSGRKGFRQTCFRMDAATSVLDMPSTEAATLRPRESFTKLALAPTAGIWTLKVSDSRGYRDTSWIHGFSISLAGALPGEIIADSSTFLIDAGIYAAVPQHSQNFTFTYIDGVGCTHILVYPVIVRQPCNLELNQLGYQSPKCPQSEDGEVLLYASSAQGEVVYTLGSERNTSGKFERVGAGIYLANAQDSAGCTASLRDSLPSVIQAGLELVQEVMSCEPLRYRVAIDTFGTLKVRTIQWMDDAGGSAYLRENLLPGSYRLRSIDERNCVDYHALDLPNTPRLGVRVLAQAPSCNADGNGLLQLIPLGGQGPYDAIWDDIASGLERKFLFAGQYRGKLFDSRGCEVPFSAQVVDPPILTGSLAIEPSPCGNLAEGAVVIDIAGGSGPYQTRLDGGSWQMSTLHYGLSIGQHLVEARDQRACHWQDSFLVQSASTLAQSLDLRELNLPEPFGYGDTFLLDLGDKFGQFDLVKWRFTNTAWFGCASCAKTSFVAFEAGQLGVTLQDSLGCQLEASLPIRVSAPPVVMVPTGFAPESVQFDDRILRVHGRSGTVIDRFAVFDRWGAQVYEDSAFRVNAPRGWDGNHRGNPAPAGVYIYEVDVREASGAVSRIRGSTILVR